MSDKPTIFAIDFGTSNSLLAAARPGRVFDPAPLDPDAADPTVLRSALLLRLARRGYLARPRCVRRLQRGNPRGFRYASRVRVGGPPEL